MVSIRIYSKNLHYRVKVKRKKLQIFSSGTLNISGSSILLY